MEKRFKPLIREYGDDARAIANELCLDIDTVKALMAAVEAEKRVERFLDARYLANLQLQPYHFRELSKVPDEKLPGVVAAIGEEIRRAGRPPTVQRVAAIRREVLGEAPPGVEERPKTVEEIERIVKGPVERPTEPFTYISPPSRKQAPSISEYECPKCHARFTVNWAERAIEWM